MRLNRLPATFLLSNMKLTRAMIDSGRSEGGGWNAPQLKLIGVEWPPARGWPDRIIGNEISSKDYETFLALKGIRKKNKVGAPRRAPKEHAELFDQGPSAEDFANDIFEETDGDLSA